MKFKCGPTQAQKRKLATEKAGEKLKKLEQWHRTFLFWPLRVGENDCRWLEFVEQRMVFKQFSDDMYYTRAERFRHYEESGIAVYCSVKWEYRAIEKEPS